VQNVVATYIGVALYVMFYLGYSVFERFYEGKSKHFVPTSEIDFVTEAVWNPGEGVAVRERDKNEKQALRNLEGESSSLQNIVWTWVKRYVY
jgi:amino acid permease